MEVFDREERQSYVVIVKAEDGSPSARPNVPHPEPNSGMLLCLLLVVNTVV